MGSNVSADLYMKRGIMQLSRERRTNFNRSFDPCMMTSNVAAKTGLKSALGK